MFLMKRKAAALCQNKRQYERVGFEQASYYRILNGRELQTASECLINNISIGGLGGLSFDTSSMGITEGDRLVVLYQLGTTIRKDRVRVSFVWLEPEKLRFGCEFIDDDTERTSLILRHVCNSLA